MDKDKFLIMIKSGSHEDYVIARTVFISTYIEDIKALGLSEDWGRDFYRVNPDFIADKLDLSRSSVDFGFIIFEEELKEYERNDN